MRFMHATNAQVVDDDPVVEVEFTNNVSGDGSAAFKADWIEVYNAGAQSVCANPFREPASATDGVVIPTLMSYRFEWGEENPQARDKGGFDSIFLLSNAASTTVSVTAGAA